MQRRTWVGKRLWNPTPCLTPRSPVPRKSPKWKGSASPVAGHGLGSVKLGWEEWITNGLLVTESFSRSTNTLQVKGNPKKPSDLSHGLVPSNFLQGPLSTLSFKPWKTDCWFFVSSGLLSVTSETVLFSSNISLSSCSLIWSLSVHPPQMTWGHKSSCKGKEW